MLIPEANKKTDKKDKKEENADKADNKEEGANEKKTIRYGLIY